jgi:hypothetical protein
MKNLTIVSTFIISLGLVNVAGAVTTEESLIIQGRSIPENSISISTSPVSVGGDLTIETGFGVVGKPFILDGTKSQDDGVVRTFIWRQVSGPTIALSSVSALKPTFTPSVAGTYVFELAVTDATGRSSVAQKSTFTVGNDAPVAKTTPPPPPPSPSGDPDFDLLKISPSPVSVGDLDRDGAVDVVTTKVPPPSPSPSSGLTGSDSGVGEIKAQTIPTVSNEGRDRSKESDASAGKGSADERTAIGDPDFDLLNISVGGDDLEKFRTEVSSADTTKKVIVRGWDPEKKEEIVARPLEVKTTEDLKVYVEAVALSDAAIQDIRIKKDVIEVESREPGKLFGFIPVQMTRTVAVKFNLSDSSADPVDVEFSWWHVFVKKSESRAELTKEINTELNLLKMEDMKRVRSESKISSYAATLRLISSVMKTKHDTVKNSISNVR